MVYAGSGSRDSSGASGSPLTVSVIDAEPEKPLESVAVRVMVWSPGSSPGSSKAAMPAVLAASPLSQPFWLLDHSTTSASARSTSLDTVPWKRTVSPWLTRVLSRGSSMETRGVWPTV